MIWHPRKQAIEQTVEQAVEPVVQHRTAHSLTICSLAHFFFFLLVELYIGLISFPNTFWSQVYISWRKVKASTID